MPPILDDHETALLKRLLNESISPREARQRMIKKFALERKLDDLNDQIAFERETYGMAGRTDADHRMYLHNVEPYKRALRDLEEGIVEGVINTLRNAGWLGFGIRAPITIGRKYTVIPPILWVGLELDIAKSVAKGGGYEFFDVRIVRLGERTKGEVWMVDCILQKITEAASADSPEKAASTAAAPDRRVDVPPTPVATTQEVNGDKPGPAFVGRPSVMYRVHGELQRRAAAGEMAPTLAAESRYLVKWAEETIIDHQTPKQKAIENAIRAQYWALQRREAP